MINAAALLLLAIAMIAAPYHASPLPPGANTDDTAVHSAERHALRPPPLASLLSALDDTSYRQTTDASSQPVAHMHTSPGTPPITGPAVPIMDTLRMRADSSTPAATTTGTTDMRATLDIADDPDFQVFLRTWIDPLYAHLGSNGITRMHAARTMAPGARHQHRRAPMTAKDAAAFVDSLFRSDLD